VKAVEGATASGIKQDPLPRILIVDDDAETRDLLRATMEDEGFVVMGFAAGGAEAVGLAGELLPDVVLMDQKLPELDGIQATRLIKRDHPSVQVVILTVYDDPYLRDAARAAGAFAYLVKGCAPSMISEAIVEASRFSVGEDEPR
jgi:CheY-like chemotaxis protein